MRESRWFWMNVGLESCLRKGKRGSFGKFNDKILVGYIEQEFYLVLNKGIEKIFSLERV
jgi:hypothetical protein